MLPIAWAHIAGAAFSISIWEAANKDRHIGLDLVLACLPDNGTSEEYLKVVLHYLDENPNKLHLAMVSSSSLLFETPIPVPRSDGTVRAKGRYPSLKSKGRAATSGKARTYSHTPLFKKFRHRPPGIRVFFIPEAKGHAKTLIT